MRSIYDFIISPKSSRYSNTKKIGDKDLILNTEIYNHQFVSRIAIVKSIPIAVPTKVQVGDEVIVHHNVFRRWHNVKSEEKNSRSYIDENTYCVKEDQIFSYKKNNKWIDIDNYLKKEYKNKVFCIDASSESKINPGPFTISQMAIASKKINSLIQKFKK